MGVYKVGKYWHMCYTDKNGVHKRKTTGLERALFSKDQARDLLKEKIKKTKKAQHPNLEIELEYPFEKFAKEFEENYDGKRHNITEGSMANYKLLLEKLKAHFGGMNIEEIQDNDIDDYIAKRKKDTVRGLGKRKISTSTINRELAVLRLMLNWGKKKKYISENPVGEKLARENLSEEKPRDIYFTNEEISALLSAAREPWKSFLLVGLNTGMRLDEIQRLRWDEVDTKNRSIKLPPERTKNKKGREICLNKTMVEFFKGMKLTKSENEFVFPNPETNNPYSKCFSNSWKRLLRRAGIKKAGHFHDIRRTYITEAIKKGGGVKDVQRQVGHADPATTLKIYAQATTEGQQHVADLVDFSEPSGELVELPKSQAKA